MGHSGRSDRWYTRVLAAALEAAADAVAPCHCAVCGLRSNRPLELCEPCEGELPWLEYACVQCALPLANGSGLCGQCLRRPPAFDVAVAACLFSEPIAGFVHALKDAGQFAMVQVLVELLAQAVADRVADGGRPDLVIPMPLHWTRRWRRGFNQAGLLASGLRRHPLLVDLDLKIDSRLCRRRRPTPSQRALSAAQRHRNLQDAIVCGAPVDGLTVAIVDDVLTTGASADALAAALKRAGAAQVEVWCVARTDAPRR